MDLNTAQTLALDLMTEHGLIALGWRFVFDDRAKRRVGQTRYRVKEIGLSISAVPHNDEDAIRDVILHEIAHAHVGPEHGHDAVWKRMAASIGAKPRSVTKAAADPNAFRYRGRCESGGGHTCGLRMRRPEVGPGVRWKCKVHKTEIFWFDMRTNRFLGAAPTPGSVTITLTNQPRVSRPALVAAAKPANPWDGGTDWDTMFNA